MITYWVKSKKLKVLEDLEQGKETYTSLLQKHNLHPDEIDEWKRHLAQYGPYALRVTKIGKYRK